MATNWQLATVTDVRQETARARTLRLDLGTASHHLAGQHYVVRLTAPDGYTAQRSYSVASAPDGTAQVELTIERLDGGEVSEFLCDIVEPGDELEVLGPIGTWFAWRGTEEVLGVAGGSGVVPLAAMLRQARAAGRPELVRIVVSARRPADLYYRAELPGPETTLLYTRDAPAGDPRPAGRITAADLVPVLRPEGTVFVCGSPPFCDTVTDLLIGLGVRTDRIRVERFGPSG